jgi:ferric-dicitrate binding protein FerR (iron transport regulator)
MMRDDDPAIIDQAIDWHLRQADMPADAWREFVAWLELSPTHAETYDRIAMEDRLLPRPAPPVEAANDDRPAVRRWAMLAGGGGGGEPRRSMRGRPSSPCATIPRIPTICARAIS